MLSLQDGCKITYSWTTGITKGYSGIEQRVSPNGSPKVRVEGAAFLLDAGDRDVRAALVRGAASGSNFLLGLPFEAIPITANAVGAVITVASTAQADWVRAGQRVAVVSPSGVVTQAVVQSSSTTTITLDVAPGTVGRAGARIMPLLSILLDPQQGFSRYPVTVDIWQLRALAALPGWGAVDSMGIGTSITTYSGGSSPVLVDDLSDDDLLIWDRTNAIDGQATEGMFSLAQTIDLGGLPFSTGGASVPEWGRSIKLRSSRRDDFQWLKAFVRHVRGAQGAFLLSTNHPDLIFDSLTAGGIKIKSASVTGSGDYVAWFASHAHRRLALALSDGSKAYVTVAAVGDSGDGTLTLTLDTVPTLTATKISYLEQVRIEKDDVEVTWTGGTFTVDLAVRAVQDTIIAAAFQPFVFDVALDTFMSNTPPGDKALLVALGQTTFIALSTAAAITISGIHNTATAGNVDGMVVCIADVGGHGFFLDHDVTGFGGVATDNLLLIGSTLAGGVRMVQWLRYVGSLGRWVNFWRA